MYHVFRCCRYTVQWDCCMFTCTAILKRVPEQKGVCKLVAFNRNNGSIATYDLCQVPDARYIRVYIQCTSTSFVSHWYIIMYCCTALPVYTNFNACFNGTRYLVHSKRHKQQQQQQCRCEIQALPQIFKFDVAFFQTWYSVLFMWKHTSCNINASPKVTRATICPQPSGPQGTRRGTGV